MTSSQRTIVVAIGERPSDDPWSAVDRTVQVVHVDRDAEWWTSGPAADLGAGDRVVLVDASWVPGTRLVERLLAGPSGVIVDARVLPVETTRVHDAREDGDDVEPPRTAAAPGSPQPAAWCRPSCSPTWPRSGG